MYKTFRFSKWTLWSPFRYLMYNNWLVTGIFKSDSEIVTFAMPRHLWYYLKSCKLLNYHFTILAQKKKMQYDCSYVMWRVVEFVRSELEIREIIYCLRFSYNTPIDLTLDTAFYISYRNSTNNWKLLLLQKALLWAMVKDLKPASTMESGW